MYRSLNYNIRSVSYTHLDVYKRQILHIALAYDTEVTDDLDSDRAELVILIVGKGL